MPEISRFYGVIVRIFSIDNEHPPKHIHAKYNEFNAVIELDSLNIIEGSLPKRARIIVREWAELHQDELIDMWNSQEFHKIKPLD